VTTNYHTALSSTDELTTEAINSVLRDLGQQLEDMNDGTHAFSAIDVDGGTVDGATIGANSAAAGTFTDLTVTNDIAVGSALMVGIRYGQYVATATTATVQWNNILLDTDDAYSLTTYRWTPTTAGWYALSAAVTFELGNSAKQNIVWIRKNGSAVALSYLSTKGTFNETIASATLQQANGTTDYFDVQFTNGDTGSRLIIPDGTQSLFAGFRRY